MGFMELDELKKEYSKYEKKYKLPSFAKLNEDFEIDKIERESDCFIRIVRKTMIEKVVNSINFLEMLLNPVNAPRLYLSYIKSMTSEDRENIDKIYSALADISIISLDLEIDYSEKAEAELIIKMSEAWNSIKPNFRKIMANMKNPVSIANRKEKSYFG